MPYHNYVHCKLHIVVAEGELQLCKHPPPPRPPCIYLRDVSILYYLFLFLEI